MALPLLWRGGQWAADAAGSVEADDGDARTGAHVALPEVSFLPLAAASSLGALEPQIPRQARVLLVTPSPFVVPYDFYLLPRPLTVLMRLDATLVAKSAALHPGTARQAERWLEKLHARGLSLTEERLRAELPRADYVITFLGDAAQLGLHRPDLLPPGATLELVDRQRYAALYRRVRP